MRVEGTLDKTVIHAGESAGYNASAYCGFEFEGTHDYDLIFSYRLYATWVLSKLPEERSYELCEKCLQSPDMAIRLLGCLDED